MSGKSSTSHSNHVSSRVSRFKARVSSIFSPSSPNPNSRLSGDDRARLAVPAYLAEDQLPPVSPSIPPPIPSFYADHLKAPDHQNYSSTHLAPSSPLQLPRERLSPHSQYLSSGTLGQAHNFVMKDPIFIDNNTTVDNFMEKFLQHTIIGAEFDSSDRDPPPRCHPGTRLTIIQRCLYFIVECRDEEKLRWLVGPAGVGKSAIMQIVAENAPHGDGTKIILTIAYQLAVKSEPYRRFIQNEITRDPSLLRKSLSVHFKRFIVEPCIHQNIFYPARRLLILIDGLDECDNPRTQRELLRLITDFCNKHSDSPVAWIVASRPEPHITSFFEKAEVHAASREEIVMDSDEACEDVQRYLRAELKKIKLEYASLKRKREWPSEIEFTEIATAAGGLFAYASTVTRYIDDPYYGDPAAQLRYLLGVIHAGGKDDTLRRDHPMAQLDALYARILSNITDAVMVNTRKLLLLYATRKMRSFRLQCNALGLTEDDAYAAVRHLHAVAKVPEPDSADEAPLQFFHKSFEDFLFDSNRSGFSDDIQDDIDQVDSEASWRVVEGVPDDSDHMSSGEGIECRDGYLKGGPGLCDNISLSWPGDERFQKSDDELRVELYCDAMLDMCSKFGPLGKFHGSMSCFHSLTTRFISPPLYFPFYPLRDSAFDHFRQELVELGKLKRVPLRALDYAAICGDIELRFTSPIGTDIERTDPWNPSCEHQNWELDCLQQGQGWRTNFTRFVQEDSYIGDFPVDADDVPDADIPLFNAVEHKEPHREFFPEFFDRVGRCEYCSRRLAREFIRNPDELATVFVDSTEMCYVEFSFVDPDDGVSEWRYRLLHSGLPTNTYT
ncbi:hypothetical protein Agabi119p4_4872 [Agaricus bisporus var. burnettii]|uniref:NACHT domain-containing protein n=1 Tax=Agaricus bisporus var. burnettii TaxID=192524 RepID=A0A8H7F447_AGABI|nr:hypothetical protein Agabi119p4_4872 [Agaricus bisporus var. burnettii]